MRVLITGADSQLGSELTILLGSEAISTTKETLDITNAAMVRSFFEFEQPDTIINCAESTELNQSLAVNVLGVANLLRGAADCIFVQLSTSMIFSSREHPYTEKDKPQPLTIYGATKAVIDQCIKVHPRHYIIRTSNLYSRGHKNFVTHVLDQAKSGLVIVPNEITQLTYAGFLAKQIVWMLHRQPEHGIYNIVDTEIASLAIFAKLICQKAGLTAEIKVEGDYKQQILLSTRKFESYCRDLSRSGLNDFFIGATNG